MLTTRTTRFASIAGVAGAAALMTTTMAAPAYAETEVDRPDEFTSAFTVTATPDQIINSEGDTVPGEEGATGTFNFMINSDEEIICYDITLDGVTPPYESPAKTATHIHEAVAGEAGPPRLAFENPQGDGDQLTSSGCLQGPFTTGLEGDDGADTAEGFSLAEIEADPAAFFADTHTTAFPAGAVRGQLQPMPVGGVDTGMGGAAAATTAAAPGTSSGAAWGVAAASLLGLTAVGTVTWRRQARED